MKRKTLLKRKTSNKSKKQQLHKVTAAYTGSFTSAAIARAAQQKLKVNPRAHVSPVKKTGKGYSFSVKYMFLTPSARVRDMAVREARKNGAKVSVGSIKA